MWHCLVEGAVATFQPFHLQGQDVSSFLNYLSLKVKVVQFSEMSGTIHLVT